MVGRWFSSSVLQSYVALKTLMYFPLSAWNVVATADCMSATLKYFPWMASVQITGICTHLSSPGSHSSQIPASVMLRVSTSWYSSGVPLFFVTLKATM